MTPMLGRLRRCGEGLTRRDRPLAPLMLYPFQLRALLGIV